MLIPREQIYSSLLAILQNALLAPAGSFKSVSRRWQDPAQISPADRPALYQVQRDETAKTNSINSLPIEWRIGVDLVLYTSGDASPSTVPSTELNTLLDSVEEAIKTATPGLAQSLGARVSHCRIDGKVLIVENVQGTMSLAVIPVEVVLTA